MKGTSKSSFDTWFLDLPLGVLIVISNRPSCRLVILWWLIFPDRPTLDIAKGQPFTALLVLQVQFSNKIVNEFAWAEKFLSIQTWGGPLQLQRRYLHETIWNSWEGVFDRAYSFCMTDLTFSSMYALLLPIGPNHSRKWPNFSNLTLGWAEFGSCVFSAVVWSTFATQCKPMSFFKHLMLISFGFALGRPMNVQNFSWKSPHATLSSPRKFSFQNVCPTGSETCVSIRAMSIIRMIWGKEGRFSGSFCQHTCRRLLIVGWVSGKQQLNTFQYVCYLWVLEAFHFSQ